MANRVEQDQGRSVSTSDSDGSRSRAVFPYVNLEEAVRLVRAVSENGGSGCELGQLSGWLGTTLSSSSFRIRVSAAKMFGLIERRSKSVQLTELGFAVVDPDRQDEAKVQAFLAVPLYKSLHKKFDGRILPKDSGLEAEMRALGVPEKSATRARQVFQKSAASAGFFATGRDRLVRPASSNGVPTKPATETDTRDKQDPPREHAPRTGPADPLLEGLWSKLPDGRPFSPADRARWLELAKLALDMVYGDEDDTRSEN